MANDGQIVFEVTADGKHAIADIKDITRAIQQETGKWDDSAKQSTNNINNAFSSMLKKITAGFSAVKISQALLDIGKASISAASDLQEVQNVVDVTFGSAGAGKIEAWAKSAGTQFGLTETQAKKFTSTLGAMMKSSGLAGEEIVDMSTDLAGLAADMASFYNLDFDTAFQKIRSGISGETEPLKQLGINMSVANLNAYALKQGLSKTFEEMTQGEQTMLRYQYLMSATADAQGDFARTSDEYANNLRTLETNIETLKTTLGTYLLPVINEVVGGINSLFADRSGEKTVLDDFAAIDAGTESKLEEIRKTATTAKELAEELEAIGKTDTSKAGKSVQSFVDGLSNIDLSQNKSGLVKDFIGELTKNIDTLSSLQGTSNEEAKAWLEGIADSASKLTEGDVAGWEKLVGVIKEGLPGFENTDLGSSFFEALSKVEISDKATAIKDFIGELKSNIDTVSALSGKDAEGAKEWLEGISEAADSLSPEDAEGWATLLNSIKEGLPGLENTDFGAAFFASLGEGFSSVQQKSSVLQWAVESLGNKTNRTAEEQALWLETCQRLVKTIPGLSSIINTETGEIKGGTQAVRDYIQAWEDGQTKLAMMGALEEKENALSSRFSDLPGLQLDMAVAEKRLRDRNKKIQALMEKYGLDDAYENFLKQGDTGLLESAFDKSGATQDELEQMYSLLDGYEGLVEEADKATEAYNTQKTALDEATVALEEMRETVDEMPGTIDEATDATEEWLKATGKTREEVQSLVDVAKESVDALNEYVEEARSSALSAINSVASGLDAVDFQSYGSQIDKITELTMKQANTKVGSDEWKSLQSQIDEVNSSLVTTDNIYKNLESQGQWIDSYLENLKKAQEMGLSDALLAELSDGSVESAEYLDAIVNDKTGKTAAEIDEKYQEIQEKKAALSNELANQQLTVDETYQNLAESAKEAVAALDLQGEAAANSGATVSGIAQGISEHVPEVEEAVNSIIAELEKLNGYGIDIDLGGFGHINITTSTGKTEGSHRTGLSFVPHDDYIARLHEGERVLTAQENQIWNALHNGGISGFDLEDLGGVMRDNVKAGGNVYLDGRTVGSVISDQQGKSYRQLQRSGWQA